MDCFILGPGRVTCRYCCGLAAAARGLLAAVTTLCITLSACRLLCLHQLPRMHLYSNELLQHDALQTDRMKLLSSCSERSYPVWKPPNVKMKSLQLVEAMSGDSSLHLLQLGFVLRCVAEYILLQRSLSGTGHRLKRSEMRVYVQWK